jgi:hypothetical protein
MATIRIVKFKTLNVKHLKEISRGGLNSASGNFPAGSNVRFKHSK